MSYFYRLALPGPFLKGLDYKSKFQNLLGKRVWVSMGHRKKVLGIVIQENVTPDIAHSKIKEINNIIDERPLIPAHFFKIWQWMAQYYHHPIGDTIWTFLPKLFQQGKDDHCLTEQYWQLTQLGKEVTPNTLPKRAILQFKCLTLLQQNPNVALPAQQFSEADISSTLLKTMAKKGWVETKNITQNLTNDSYEHLPALTLNVEQDSAVNQISRTLGQYSAHILEGVTGSGKTEVYLRVIDAALEKGHTALVLVPEIGLTPQTVSRFKKRFNVPVLPIHSLLTDSERLKAWFFAQKGQARIIIGTRSAIFSPLPNLGIIIIDEEHDLSFKQQSGLRYSARDIALVLGKHSNCPVILGSATPSLETLYNLEHKAYHHHILSHRAGSAVDVQYHLIDTRQHKLNQGLSKPMIEAMQSHLDRGCQVILFLNRRGYSPLLMCDECGFTPECERCDVSFTLHQNPQHLKCHYCEAQRPIMTRCPSCNKDSIINVGYGTERIEQYLCETFPDRNIIRIDRESTRKKGQLDTYLEAIQDGDADILVGTQMLAKGHHFPNVTMVGIIDADHGIFSQDFRAMERLGQLLLQVSGRAGRAEKQGEVYIQSHHPDHTLLRCLLSQGYRDFAKALLKDRQEAKWPPYQHMAILRAEAKQIIHPRQFLQQLKHSIPQTLQNEVTLFGPTPALMSKRAGYYRMQLIIQAKERKPLHQALSLITQVAYNLKKRNVRWSLDVDPLEID